MQWLCNGKSWVLKICLPSLALLVISQASEAVPLGTGFTYQGFIEASGAPASGIYDLEFKIYDSPDNGTGNLLGMERLCGVDVADGIFSVELDFGDVYDGSGLWLEVGVADAGDCDDSTPFTFLSPLQAITATPYALFALEGNEGPPGQDGEDGQDGMDGAPGLPGPPGASPFGLNGNDAFYTVGNVGIGTMTPSSALEVAGGSVLFSGTSGSGTIPTEGAGTRFLWYPGKATLRAGEVDGSTWDDANIGDYSVAFGRNTTASGDGAFAAGLNTNALGNRSIALGNGSEAIGAGSFAVGEVVTAQGLFSVAFGEETFAGSWSMAMGSRANASGSTSLAIGNNTVASGSSSVAGGFFSEASGNHSTAFGDHTTAMSYDSFVIGRWNEVGGAGQSWLASDPLFVIGNGADEFNRSNALTVLKNGAMGIGVSSPSESLEVAGNISASGTVCDLNGCIGDGGSVWESNPSGTHYLDGNVGIGTPFPDERLDVIGNIEFSGRLTGSSCTATGEDAVAFGGSTSALGLFAAAFGSATQASGPRSAAFGSGGIASGGQAVAMGSQTVASGAQAVAMGNNSDAVGGNSLAVGLHTRASGEQALAGGDSSTASGNNSIALGVVTEAQAYASLSLGRFNVVSGNATTWVSSDPVITVGNGFNSSNRSNALTLFKNGNLTIGGSLSQSSDERLKQNIEALASVSDRLLALQPVSFDWRSPNAPEGRQIGLIAQEVEQSFPELVTTDVSGYKAVNYAGLVAPLIAVLKDQQQQIEVLSEHLCSERPTLKFCG